MGSRGPQPLPREHGTPRGYMQHWKRSDMPACGPCLDALRQDRRERPPAPVPQAYRKPR